MLIGLGRRRLSFWEQLPEMPSLYSWSITWCNGYSEATSTKLAIKDRGANAGWLWNRIISGFLWSSSFLRGGMQICTKTERM